MQRSLFVEHYTAEPLCSDEVVPLLALLSGETEQSEGLRALLKDPATLYNTSAVLREYGAEARCHTFVFWPGCLSPHPAAPMSFIAEKAGPASWVNAHPVVLDSLSPRCARPMVEVCM